MKPFDLIPTPDDFARALADFDAALLAQPADKRDFQFYAVLFRDAGQKADDNGDLGLTMAHDVFNSLCIGTLSPDAPEPLGEEVAQIGRNFSDGKESFDGLLSDDGATLNRWCPIARLRWAHYDALRAVYPSIADDALRARVADLLWLTRKDFRAANDAIKAYLDYSQTRKKEGWNYSLVPLQSALRIERKLNQRNGPAFQRAHSEMQSHADGDLTFYSSYLMKTMLDLKIGDPILCGALAEAAAKAAEIEDDPHWGKAENYWMLAAQWHSRAKDLSAREATRWSLARCYEKHADFILNRPNQIMPQSHAAHWIEKAVETLRDLGTPNAKTEADKLHLRLLALQSRALGEMPVTQHPVDLSAMVSASQQRVTGKPLFEALGAVAYGHNPLSIRTICRETYAISRQTVFLSRTQHRQISPTGGTAALNTLKTDDEKLQKREVRRVRMVQYARMNQELAVQGSILPAIAVLNDEHRVTLPILLPILQDCIFVLDGFKPLFARGLVAGIQNDWTVASHLLIPQIENGLRGLLVWLGATIPDEVQRGEREWGMQDFLRDDDCCARLETVFDAALIYDARVLLVEKFGANLRPHISHGLLPQGAFFSPYAHYMVYVWWLALRLCFDTLQFQASLSEPVAGAEDSS